MKPCIIVKYLGPTYELGPRWSIRLWEGHRYISRNHSLGIEDDIRTAVKSALNDCGRDNIQVDQVLYIIGTDRYAVTLKHKED